MSEPNEIEVKTAKEQLEEERQATFVEHYEKACTSLQATQRQGLEALEDLANFGAILDTIRRDKGKYMFEWMQSLPIGGKIKEIVLKLAVEANHKRKKGIDLDCNQLSLALCSDDQVKNEPPQRIKRDRAGKWIRHAGITKKELDMYLEKRGIDTIGKSEARQGLQALRPIIEVARKLKQIVDK